MSVFGASDVSDGSESAAGAAAGGEDREKNAM
jgi:hypothetical protein